ncbi:MAG TPA: peptide chain release factor N(5)-glutamine methyltransferase [Mycobacteriales bacterium]|nr:peptide chain release factor N(5)-glutamine methyltransferase [Mycobacteriales bacterium]
MTGPGHPVSLDRLLRDAAETLATAGIESARADAELLAAHVLGISRQTLARDLILGRRTATESQLERFLRLVAQRATRVPLQHLTGIAPFRRIELSVGPGVFIPRPETELLAGWGIERLSARPSGADRSRAVDLCAGSGAIGLALANELPGMHVTAVESDPGALPWLARNVANVGIAEGSGVEIVSGDATDPGVLGELDGSVNLVLSNPPYIDRVETVAPEAGHDPAEALWADEGGLAVLRGVVRRAESLLHVGGQFGIEHAESQGAAVRKLLPGGVWREIATHHDLAGRDRFTTAQRR